MGYYSFDATYPYSYDVRPIIHYHLMVGFTSIYHLSTQLTTHYRYPHLIQKKVVDAL